MIDKVFVGWDKRESEAYECCVHSIEKYSFVETCPLVQSTLRKCHLYTRPKDEMASTEFSNTRFLVPYLMEYDGWAVFMDCDMLLTCDIQKMLKDAKAYAKRNKKKLKDYAVFVVKHNYVPKKSVKMDGCLQKPLPKKNWSSVMLFNCNHHSTRNLTLEYVNNVNAGILHRFEWAKEEEIGELEVKWNWLEGEYDKPEKIPNIIHYTNGHIFFENIKSHDYDEELRQAKKEIENCNAMVRRLNFGH